MFFFACYRNDFLCILMPYHLSSGVGQRLEHWGVETHGIIEFDWWESKTIVDNFELISTPVRHFS